MKTTRILTITVFVLHLFSFVALSQTKPLSKKIIAQVDNKGFFSNSEYNLSQVNGYTLIGNRFSGKVNYTIAPKFAVYLGVDWLKYNGLDGFHKIKPIMGLRVNPMQHLSITIGSYDVSHRSLPLPIYHWERPLTHFMEEGVNIKYTSNIYHADIWLNWEKFILQDDPFQEHFTVGWAQHFNVIRTKNFELKLPIHTLFDHHGGQIDTSDEPVNTILNLTTGLDLHFAFQNTWIQSLDLNLWYCYFNQTEKKYPHNNGFGYFPSLKLQTSHFMVESGYWYGKHFYAPMGTPLFQSVAYGKDEWIRAENKTAYLNVAYRYSAYDNVHFEIGSHVFYAFLDKKIQYTYELSIHFTEDFFIYGFNRKR